MYLFTSEAVSPGHPDKCADIIADTIVDELLQRDSKAKVASEVFLAGKNIILGGEITTVQPLTNREYVELTRGALRKIGYRGNQYFSSAQCLNPDEVQVQVLFNQQSPDISQGVAHAGGEIGAGDQGLMFGYADIETVNYMPSAITFARQIMEKIYHYALENPHQLGVDIKTQVTVDYGTKENFDLGRPQKIHTIVAAAPCVESMTIEQVRSLVRGLIDQADLPPALYDPQTCIIHINSTGKYVNHSALHDSGLTGRKLIADSYGGYAPIGGGAQSSKDYTKVDRSAFYAARWLAKHIAAAGLARKALVQLSYGIGLTKPISIAVNTFNTAAAQVTEEQLTGLISDNFSLSPSWIIDKFQLAKPGANTFLYADVAARGQAGQPDYPWEQLDSLPLFKSAAAKSSALA